MKKGLLRSLLLTTLIGGTLYGANTKTDISMLYVSLLNRASEGEGNQYWQNTGLSMEATVDAMLATSDAQTYFGSSLDTNQAFVEHIYKNTLNKLPSDDPDGISYWVNLLNSGTSRGTMVVSFVNAATDPVNAGEAQNQFNNRVALSNYMADTVEKAPSDYATSTSFSHDLVVTSDANTITTAKGLIGIIVNGSTENKAPSVNAGADKTVTVNQSITLTGSANDSDGTIVSYEWKKGSEVLGTSATLEYIPTEVGTDILTLTVMDDDGSSNSDSVEITVQSAGNIR
jgi:hypothetical protein